MLRNGPSEQLLENPVRAEIVDQLRARPGLSFLELRDLVASALGRPPMGHGTVSHHLYHLERARLITSRRAGRHRRFFLPQHAAHATRTAAMHDPTVARLMDLVAGNPGVGQTPIVETLSSRSRPSLSRTLRRMHDARLVRRARDGHAVRYWPTSAGLTEGRFPESMKMANEKTLPLRPLMSFASFSSTGDKPASGRPHSLHSPGPVTAATGINLGEKS